MMQHRYPFAVLHLELDQQKVDVNVHPAKMELRFEQEQEVYETLLEVLTRTLKGKEFIPEVELAKREEAKKTEKRAPEPFERKRMEAEQLKRLASYGKPMEEKHPQTAKPSGSISKSIISANEKPQRNEEIGKRSEISRPVMELPLRETPSYPIENRSGELRKRDVEQKEAKPEQMTLFEENLLSKAAQVKHRLIGQLFDTYWLIQYEDKLFIMDQHAAHEKVLYEKTMKSLKKKEFTTQMVSPPIIISLTRKEEAILEKYKSHFTELGYEISPFGGREYAVSGVPGNLFGIPEKEMLTELFSSLEEEAAELSSELITDRIASLSCKAAVKGNHKMSVQEANALIEQLMELDNPYACPHGRPTMISMSKYELEKKFKRII